VDTWEAKMKRGGKKRGKRRGKKRGGKKFDVSMKEMEGRY
jgi:hypothetical protein